MPFWHTHEPRSAPERPLISASSAISSSSIQSDVASDPVLWAQARLGFDPDPVQAEILRSAAKRLILCCTRQFGKSTITAIKALHHAFTHPGALVIAAAPTARQSGEWLEKARGFLSRLGVRSRSDGHNRLSLVLNNGSRLVSLPGVPGNIRGFSKASLVLIDEAAFVPDELYEALNPMLAVSRGGLWLMSTPGAQSGFFYEEWSREHSGLPGSFEGEASGTGLADSGESDLGAVSPDASSAASGASVGSAETGSESSSPVAWERYKIAADQCPRIPPEFLAEQRVLLGEPAFRREYMCEFVAAGTQIIDRALLDLALDDDIAPFNNGSALWH